MKVFFCLPAYLRGLCLCVCVSLCVSLPPSHSLPLPLLIVFFSFFLFSLNVSCVRMRAKSLSLNPIMPRDLYFSTCTMLSSSDNVRSPILNWYLGLPSGRTPFTLPSCIFRIDRCFTFNGQSTAKVTWRWERKNNSIKAHVNVSFTVHDARQLFCLNGD